MASRVARALVDDVGTAVEVLLNTPGQLVPLIWTAGVGVLLLIFRFFFLESCPTFADYSIIVALAIDARAIQLAILWRKMAGALEVLSIATGQGDLLTKWIGFVDPAAIKEFFNNAPVACVPYDSVGAIMEGLGRLVGGSAICPLLRYVYPVDWLYTFLNTMLGWMSSDADPTNNNCENNDRDIVGCVALGSGYVVLEVLVPMIVLAWLLPLIKSIVSTAFICVIESVRVSADLLRFVKSKISL